MSYMQTAEELKKEVNKLMAELAFCDNKVMTVAERIGHIINLAIRACPRGVQHTVRRNIVAKAVEDYCRVTMTEETDEHTGRSYHKISITPRS